MDHPVYNCGWKKTRRSFELWTLDLPVVRAQGATYEEAEDRLMELIEMAGQKGTRGFCSERIGVVKTGYTRTPDLPVR